MRSRFRAIAALLVLALALLMCPSLAGADSIDWQPITGVGSDHLYDIIYGGGRFVAVGANGTILTSPDGSNWTRQASGTSWTLRTAAYGNGQFVVVGRNESTGEQVVLTSTDAATWQIRPFGGGQEPVNGIAYGNGRFVFVGDGYAIVSTTDFASWQKGDYSPEDPTWTLHDIAYGDDIFVAVGDRWITSADGLRWENVTPYSAGRAVTFMAGRFHAQGGVTAGPPVAYCTPELSVSDGGRRWQCRGNNPPFSDQHWNSIAFGSNHYVFAGSWQINAKNFQGLISSNDAQSWVTYPQTQQINKVAYGARHFVAVGLNGTILISQAFPKPPIPSYVRRSVQNVTPAEFRDLSTNHWAYEEISLIASAGVMEGYPYIDPDAGELSSGTLFRPDAPVTRAEFLVMLLRAFPFSSWVPTGDPFADVPQGHWAYEATHQARHIKLVTGYNNQFHPDAPISRAEMATLLRRRIAALDEPSEAVSFIDITPAYSWARPHIELLAAYGLITGLPDGTFRPAQTATRAEAAALLSRLY